MGLLTFFTASSTRSVVGRDERRASGALRRIIYRYVKEGCFSRDHRHALQARHAKKVGSSCESSFVQAQSPYRLDGFIEPGNPFFYLAAIPAVSTFKIGFPVD